MYLAVVFTLLLTSSFACKCAQRPFCEQTSSVDYLVQGRVVSSRNTDMQVLYTLRVVNVFKGGVDGKKTFEVQSALSSAACGVELETGKEYLIAANKDLSINSCGPTRPWSDLTREELGIVKGGGECASCKTVLCKPHQKCHVTNEGKPYCADFCHPDRCGSGQICTMVTRGDCDGKTPCPEIAICEPAPTPDCMRICSTIYQPVCGSNGQTYGNACLLGNAVCQNPKLTMVHNGECCKKGCCAFQECRRADDGEEYCADICHENRCDKGFQCELQKVQCVRAPCPPKAVCVPSCQSKACPEIFQPVCGNDGQTYGNGCELSRGQCENPLLKEEHKGACKRCPTKAICPQVYKPVCGSDRKTYTNRCYFNFAKCRNPQLTVVNEGPCTDEKCNKGCTKIYQPVCSNQGVTYGNQCELDRASCQDPNIWRKSEGECKKC